jgi:LmbE family N-acetylglucosaminyl deacetylase
VDGDRLVTLDRPDATDVVVLSPHLDDAVFSAWNVLVAHPDARVITVFAGVPASGSVTLLDRAHGAADSGAWMRRRRDEDRAVLTSIGHSPVHLDLLDVQYRADAAPHLRELVTANGVELLAQASLVAELRVDPDVIATSVRPHLEPGSTVYATMGIGGHPDHRDVGRFAVTLARSGFDVRLYADSPYFMRRGLPRVVGGVPNPESDALIDAACGALDLDVGALTPAVTVLTVAEAERKIAAACGYATEFDAVEADFGSLVRDIRMMAHEIEWALPRGAPSGGD